jgi:adenosylcobinamide kinase/adenosylcobinamide-phosphate guanylyltransferase
LARATPGARYYLATAAPGDGEMKARIARHRAERGTDFATIETEIEVVTALDAIDPAACVVIDCLTLWLSNLLLAELSDDEILQRMDGLVACTTRRRRGPTIMISNEVGLGIVPEYELSRRFRDLSGWMHQRIAKQADAVYWACFGLALRLHPAPLLTLPRESNAMWSATRNEMVD